MTRRNFLAAAGAVSLTPLSSLNATSTLGQDTAGGNGEYIELIRYHLHTGEKKDRVSDFYRDVAIPALNRCGLDRIGVFSVLYGPNDPSLYVLIPHPSLASVFETPVKLRKDSTYLNSGREFLGAPLSDTGYVRIEKSILAAFKFMPKVEKPDALMTKGSRMYEFRIYESHSEQAGQKKIEMFNEGGEIDIFRKTGLQPVFFGETIIGARMPNLSYMLVFEDMAARDANWNRFRNDPAWTKLKADPAYKDTVSNITDIILRPASYSQI